MYAKVAVYGSDERMEALDAFHDKVRRFFIYADTYRRHQNQQEGLAESGQQMEHYRGEVRNALRVIERAMREDLARL